MPTRTQANLRHARYYAEVTNQALSVYSAGGQDSLSGLEIYDRERPQIDTGRNWTLERIKEVGLHIAHFPGRMDESLDNEQISFSIIYELMGTYTDAITHVG